MFEAGQFDVCPLFFSRFKSVMAQNADRTAAHSGGHLRGRRRQQRRRLRIRAGRGRYPRRALLPRNISVQVFRALLENTASLYGAQMTAMDNATRNAGDMIRKQTLIYNRARQAMITKELIEIISGAEMV
jgi:F-type H+-transporting ATPase subunit gamma